MKIAVFTIVQGDQLYFNVWLRYYRRSFHPRDIHVLVHAVDQADYAVKQDLADESQGKFAWEGFTFVPVQHDEAFDHRWLVDTVQAYQRFLLQSYDVVIFVEVDEILVPRPRRGRPVRLDEFITDVAGSAPIIRPEGYEVVQQLGVEPDLDWTRPILRQRPWWYPTRQYSKPAVARIPLTWELGFHDAAECVPTWRTHLDDGLLLLHLHKVDFITALARHRDNARRRLSATTGPAAGFGAQNLLVAAAALRAWWTRSVDDTGEEAVMEPIPEEIRNVGL